MTSRQPPDAHQMTLEDLGEPLAETTFVVLDLETTGRRAEDSGITEIGAVKVRGGQILGEFATLVNPGQPIPPFITLLTGITEAMVAPAPPIDAVLPSLLEFMRGGVLVAHNAPFDTGFLKSACAEHDYPWPAPAVIDTVILARRLVPRDEVPNHKLATLARFFGADHQPSHRALDDARATVGVLHALIERLGSFGVDTREEMQGFCSAPAPTPAQRRKRTIADDMPARPGVYVFEGADGKALYVGKSSNLRKRVKSYFTSAERRGRIREMLMLAERVTPIVCGTPLEAEVRELRIIAERDPAYNRRARRPERAPWLKLTEEAFPRLSIVRGPQGGGPFIGPFRSQVEADLARDALHQAIPLRQCTQRLSPGKTASSCVLAQLGRCGAPCEGRISVADYAEHSGAARAAMTTSAGEVVAALRARIDQLAAQLRYEEAAAHRDRLAAYLRGASRAQRLAALSACAHLAAARPLVKAGGYEMCVVRYGRLAASATTPPGADPRPHLRALVATAETVAPPAEPGPAPRAGALEMECVLRWLESPGVRLVELEGSWVTPADGAQRYAELTDWHRGVHPVE